MGIEEQLPEGFEGREALAKFGSVEDLARSYQELQRKMGSAIPAPTDDSSLDAVFERLGAPKEATGYSIPEGVDPKLADQIAAFAAKAKLAPQQFERLAAEFQSKHAGDFAAQQKAREEAVEKLRGDYGDSLDEAKARAFRALKAMSPEEQAAIDPSDPTTFRLLEKLGALAPGAPVSGVAPNNTQQPVMEFNPIKVAEEARRFLESKAYSDRFHEAHREAVEEYTKRVQLLASKGFDGVYDSRLLPDRSLYRY